METWRTEYCGMPRLFSAILPLPFSILFGYNCAAPAPPSACMSSKTNYSIDIIVNFGQILIRRRYCPGTARVEDRGLRMEGHRPFQNATFHLPASIFVSGSIFDIFARNWRDAGTGEGWNMEERRSRNALRSPRTFALLRSIHVSDPPPKRWGGVKRG